MKNKNWLAQIFCKHKYAGCKKIEPFFHLGGERIYIVCEKCGKIKGSYFKSWD